MSDIPTTTLVVIALYFYFKPKAPPWIAGLFFGMTLLFRQTNLILLAIFTITKTLQSIKEREYRPVVQFLLGMLPFVALVGVLNYVFYGSPITTAYAKKITGVQNFSISYAWPNFQHYFWGLNLMYPCLLISSFFAKRVRTIESVSAIFLFIVFYSVYYFHDQFSDRWATYLFGMRFLFPIVPLLLLAYCDCLEGMLQKVSERTRAYLVASITVILLVTCLGVTQHHQNLLKEQLVLKELIYGSTEENSTIIYDLNSAELIQAVWGKRFHLEYHGVEIILSFLRKADFSKPVFLVKRDVIYGTNKIKGISEEDLRQIGIEYHLQEVSRRDGLVIYKIAL